MDVKWRWKGWWRFTAVVFGNAKSRAVGRNAGKATPRKRIQMTFHPSARNHTRICSEGGEQVSVAQVSAQNPGARTWATQPKHARHALFLFGFEDHAIADRNWCMRGDGYAAWKVEPYFWNRPIRELRLRQLKLINNLKLTSGSSRK